MKTLSGSPKYFLNPFNASAWLSHLGWAFGIWAAIAPVALAQYNPPEGSSRPYSPTITTGRRGGCTGSSRTMLTILAPQTYVGQTIATHPTLSWFVPDDEKFPVELQLLHRISQQGTANPRWEEVKRISLQSTPGLMSWSLPPEEPGLVAGERYRWQVVLVCDPNHPSGALREVAEFDVVQPPVDLQRQIAGSHDARAIANLYARSGFWYDAFQQTLTNIPDPQLKGLRLDLLQDLIQIEVHRQASPDLGDEERETSMKVQEKLTRVVETGR